MVTTFTMYTGLPTRAVRIVESQLLSVTLEKKSKKKKMKLLKPLYSIGPTAFWDSTALDSTDF